MTSTPASIWLDRTHVGDCRVLLRQMADDGVRVNMCVTSPPYFGLRRYLPPDHPDRAAEIGTENTPDAFITSLVGVFREVGRLLADDGTLWLNIGDSYAGTGKSGGGRQGQRWQAIGATATGPRGGHWSPAPHGLKGKDLIGIPWMLAFALRNDGWYLRQDIIWAKPNPMPESVTDRCTRAHEYLFLLSKSRRYYFDRDAISEPSSDPRAPGNLRPVRQPPGERSSGPNGSIRGRLHQIGARGHRNRRDVWTISTQPSTSNHFAVFPDALVTPCVLAGSRIGGIVLDPFMGSGRTATAATRLRRRFIGCELNPSFLDLDNEQSPQGTSAIITETAP
ncbi:site-specific DNA-methyltransferase [Komagataeibacter nataicola]|uniref:DNA-methyltransferase n=1 Tax=Komagataeibacter nataicola TaxID=265960 RepID=UPI0023DD213A|nr:site-specific DNA-methyltransferase [Komagataeibacter nataicola]WEQ55763.1 site-specific DNA-methyltransferase [Komagataeibacter nataicola]